MARITTTLLTAVLASSLLGGCAWWKCITAPKEAPVPVAPAQPATRVELVPFQLGVSSYTVENMARERGCTGGQGAGLVSERGPVEVYRMKCDNGRTFVARCELRQCKPL
jgi:hypothetical protein